MRFRLSLRLLAMFTVMATVDAGLCFAQTQVTSLEDLRGRLAVGDVVAIVPAEGPPVAGRLLRLGQADLDLQVAAHAWRERQTRNLTVPFATIQSLERRRDSVRNGAAIGAVVGAGFGGAIFLHALAVDRNEIDEWALSYVGGAAFSTGIGALVGWAIDAARSKPYIMFVARSPSHTRVRVQPVFRPGRSIAVTVSF